MQAEKEGGCDAGLGAGVGSHLDGVASGEQAGYTVISEGILFSSLVLKVSQQLWKMAQILSR